MHDLKGIIPGVAVDNRGSGHGLGNGARAVGDGQSGSLKSRQLSDSLLIDSLAPCVQIKLFDLGSKHVYFTASQIARAYLGDGVCHSVMSDHGRSRAVGGVGSDDLGRVRDVAGPGDGTRGGSENGGNGELHFDGLFGIRGRWRC
jgi:hypothetical protein